MDDQPTTPIPTAPRHSHRRPTRTGLAALATAALLGVSGLVCAAQADDPAATTTTTQRLSPGSSASGPDVNALPFVPSQGRTGSTTGTTSDATPAQEAGLVYITTTVDYRAGKAAGTGMVMTSDGEILTNHHVIEGATAISVEVVSTGATYDAEVVGYDSTHDVAVLQLDDASGLTTVRTDTSGAVQVGDQVTGVGNANGDGGAASAAAGTVTALDRSITVQSESGGHAEQLSGLIEVSAEIIPGDSGGALYDGDGEVVGMNTAASSGSADVTGYAVPIAQALSIAQQIESGDDSSTVETGSAGFLGVQLQQSAVGDALVAGIVEGSPAESAGITAGSTITAFDGTRITSADQLPTVVAGHDAGQSVDVAWTDGSGTSHTATVTLTAGPVG
jgi:S1-C subfamily serine protease